MDKADFYREARRDRTGPMQGVRVLDTTTAWAGPMVSCVLADLGCEVIRVDLPDSAVSTWPPGIPGTGLSASHEHVNRNKASLSLDLRQPEGRDLFLELVRTADVVVENFKPGTLAGWGVGYEDCRRVRADIVYVSVSGWGQFGPWSERAGYDPGALAAGGWMSLNGSPDGPPTKAPTYLADDLAGLHGAIGALAALHHRAQTGEGQHVDVSLLDSLLFQSAGFLSVGARGGELRRWGGEVGASCPTNTFRCADGDIYLAMILDSHWKALCGVMGRPELAEAPGYATNLERLSNRDAVNGAVAAWCAERPVAAVVERLAAAGLVVSRVNTYADAAREPHVHERDMLVETVLSDGSTAPITGPAAKFSRTPTTVRAGAPVCGADTAAILAGLGVDGERLEELRGRGVV